MRLIDAHTLELKDFMPADIKPYAILSHTWGDDEPTLQEFMNGTAAERDGYTKIIKCAEQARKNQYGWIWVDTCCIDKTSSAELSEAINSMFAWYRDAGMCYAYLSDVDIPPEIDVHIPEADTAFDSAFTFSRWFTRGWTLQELLAPPYVLFFDRAWNYLAERQVLCSHIQRASGIDPRILQSRNPSLLLVEYSVAQKMSWASNRETSRPEDVAYCLLGIFGVNLPLLYGEGSQAFIRLQEEIIRRSNDQSLFAWSFKPDKTRSVSVTNVNGLAFSPAYFHDSGDIVPFRRHSEAKPTSMTNTGVEISLLHLGLPFSRQCLFLLNCGRIGKASGIGIYLTRLEGQANSFKRTTTELEDDVAFQSVQSMTVFLRSHMGPGDRRFEDTSLSILFKISLVGFELRPTSFLQSWTLAEVHPYQGWCLEECSVLTRAMHGDSYIAGFRFGLDNLRQIDILLKCNRLSGHVTCCLASPCGKVLGQAVREHAAVEMTFANPIHLNGIELGVDLTRLPDRGTNTWVYEVKPWKRDASEPNITSPPDANKVISADIPSISEPDRQSGHWIEISPPSP